MSAWELTDTTTKPDASSAARPRLLGLPGGRAATAGNLAFAGAVGTLLAGGMIGLLALNVYIQDQQLQLNKDNRQAAALALELSDKQAKAYEEAAPGTLAARAAGLGMVPNPYPAYIDLRTGKILGSPRPVTGKEMPGLAVPTALAPASSAPGAAQATVQTNVQSWFAMPAATTAPAATLSPSATASPKPSASPKATAKAATTKPSAAASATKTTATKTTAKPTATTTTKR